MDTVRRPSHHHLTAWDLIKALTESWAWYPSTLTLWSHLELARGETASSLQPVPSDGLSTPFTLARQKLQGTISLPMPNLRDWGHYVSNRMEKSCRYKAGTESSHLHISQTAGGRSLPHGLAHKQIWLAMGGQKLGGWKFPKLPLASSSQSREGRGGRGCLPTSQVHGELGSALQEGYFCVLVPLRSYFKARIALSLSFSADHDCHLGLMEDQLARACRVSWWFRRHKIKGFQTQRSWVCRWFLFPHHNR